METTFEKISRKTGAKESECKCQVCKSQCTKTPGLGTPQDIAKLIAAGYADRLAHTVWRAGVLMRLMDHDVNIIAPMYDEEKGACTFYKDGLCELHDKGLKPTECRLSHHAVRRTNFDRKKSISYNVVREWIDADIL